MSEIQISLKAAIQVIALQLCGAKNHFVLKTNTKRAEEKLSSVKADKKKETTKIKQNTNCFGK